MAAQSPLDRNPSPEERFVAYHLAQNQHLPAFRSPIDDPQIAGFVNQLDEINALADRAPGFVWRLEVRIPGQMPRTSRTTTIHSSSSICRFKESIGALRSFAYKSDHAKVFRDRAKWFEKMEKPSYCLWWIPAGHIPTVAEGRERLEHYQKH